MAVTLKQGDTAPSLVYDLRDNYGLPDDAPIDLTDATSVTFKMRPADATPPTAPVIDRAMTVSDAVNGRVTHEWETGDTDDTGTFNVEFEIAWSDGTIETVPHDSYMTVVIVDDLDAG